VLIELEEGEMDGACRTHKNNETCTNNLMGKYEAEISPCWWKDVTKIYVKERVRDCVFWIQFPKNIKIGGLS
jgi:hypothetical protein